MTSFDVIAAFAHLDDNALLGALVHKHPNIWHHAAN